MVKCFVLYCWASIRRGIDVVFVLSADALLLEHLHTESGNGSPLYPYIPCCNVWERRRQNGGNCPLHGPSKVPRGTQRRCHCRFSDVGSDLSARWWRKLVQRRFCLFSASSGRYLLPEERYAHTRIGPELKLFATVAGRRLNDDFGADSGSEKQALQIFLLLDD